MLCGLSVLDGFPREGAFHLRMVDVASFAPKIIEGNKVFGAIGIRVGKVGDAKTDVLEFLILCHVSFPRIKKMVADSSSAIAFEKS